jgi:3-deoxy-D-manno-octulosonate 8-phosphate phosphatase (KDO 8-P phosphatase)
MVRLFALDVDGTLTDGGVWMGGAAEAEWKRFDIRDGLGLVLLMRSGVEVALLSGRFSPATARRAEDLGIRRIHNGVREKLPLLAALAEELGIGAESAAYMGDDLPDLECLRWAGLGMAPADARPEALEAADWIAPSRAGYGAVRDATDFLLRRNGR